MSNDDFDALVALIGGMVHCIIERQAHPNDTSRGRRIDDEQDTLIEEMRERLVL